MPIIKRWHVDGLPHMKEYLLKVGRKFHFFPSKNAIKKAQALVRNHAKGRSLLAELKKMRQGDNAAK